jgi:hypothetical protein
MTHSPTPRYLSIQPVNSLFSPATFSVLKLSLVVRCVGEYFGGFKAHVRPVDRFMPARKAETVRR